MPMPALAQPESKPEARDEPRRGDLPQGALRRLGSLRFYHGQVIRALAFSPDGKWLASAGSSGVIYVWDVATGKAVRALRGHGDSGFRGVTWLAFLPAAAARQAPTLVSTGEDNTLRVWGAGTGKEVAKLVKRGREVAGPGALSPDGKLLVSGNAILDAATRKVLRALDTQGLPATGFAFSADGTTLVGRLVSGPGLPPGAGPPFAPLQLFRVVVAVWDAKTGKPLHRFNAGPATKVALSGDGKLLASGEPARGPLVVLDPASGDKLGSIPSTGCLALTATPDGKTLVVMERDAIRLLDFDTGKERAMFPHTHRQEPTALAVSADGAVLAVGDGGRVSLWDLARRGPLAASAEPLQPLHALALSPDGKTVLTASPAGTAFWDRAGGKRLYLRAHQRAEATKFQKERTLVVARACFCPDGKTVALAHEDGVTLWDWTARKDVRTDTFGKLRLAPAFFSADGRRLVATDAGDRAHVLDVVRGSRLQQFDSGYFRPRGAAAVLSPSGELVLHAVPSDARMPRPVGPEVKSVRVDFVECTVRNAGSGKVVFKYGRPDARADSYRAAFSPRDTLLAELTPRGLYLVDVATGKTGRPIAGRSGGEWVQVVPTGPLTFSPDGRLLAAGETEFPRPGGLEGWALAVFDVATGKRLRTLRGHAAAITAAAFIPDGSALVTASADGTALIWDVKGLLPAPAMDGGAGAPPAR
jgi:WD40 repeat protein